MKKNKKRKYKYVKHKFAHTWPTQTTSQQYTHCSSGISHRSWTCYNFIGLDFKHNTGNSSQIRQWGLALRQEELKISQQVGTEQKKLHFGHRLSQAEPSPPSKRDQVTGGAASASSSFFQKALWKRECQYFIWTFLSQVKWTHLTQHLGQYLVWSCMGQAKLQDHDVLQKD